MDIMKHFHLSVSCLQKNSWKRKTYLNASQTTWHWTWWLSQCISQNALGLQKLMLHCLFCISSALHFLAEDIFQDYPSQMHRNIVIGWGKWSSLVVLKASLNCWWAEGKVNDLIVGILVRGKLNMGYCCCCCCLCVCVYVMNKCSVIENLFVPFN